MQQNQHLNKIRDLIRRNITGPYRTMRNDRIEDCRRSDLYYRGFQYLAQEETVNGMTWTPVTGPDVLMRIFDAPEGADLPDVLSCQLNIYRGDINKFVAVSMRQPQNYKAAPVLSSQVDEVSDRLRVADSVAEYLKMVWGWDRAREQNFSILAKYGPAFLYTPVTTDASKYGTPSIKMSQEKISVREAEWTCLECGHANRQEPQEGVVSYCENCGEELFPEYYRPAQESIEIEEVEETFPGTGCDLHITSFLTVTLHPDATTAQGIKSSPWLWYEYNVDPWMIRKYLADVGKTMKDVPQATAGQLSLGGIIQERIKSPMPWTAPDITKGKIAFQRYWLDPQMYWALEDDAVSVEVRNALLAEYPDGLKVTMAGDQIIALEHEHHKMVWSVATVPNSETLMATQSVFYPYLEAQDIINDTINMTEGIIATSAPVTAFDPSKVNPDAVSKVVGRGVRKMFPVKDPRGALQDLPVSQPNGVALQFMERVLALAREIVGINPSMWGMGNHNTAREAVIANEASLQVFAPMFSSVASSGAQAFYNAAIQLAQFAPGGILPMVDGRSKPIQIPDIGVLLEGGWKFGYDPNVVIPGWARRDRLMELLNSPQTAQMMGLTHPASVKRIHEAVGMEGVYTPGLDDMDWIETQMEKLASGGEPIVPPPQLMDGNLATEYARTWLKGKKGRDLMQQDSEAWQRGVVYMMALAPPPPPPPGAGSMLPPPPEGGSGLPNREAPPISANQGLDSMGSG